MIADLSAIKTRMIQPLGSLRCWRRHRLPVGSGKSQSIAMPRLWE
jgi:hypothetical protein